MLDFNTFFDLTILKFNCRTEAEFPRALTWRKKKGRRLDFGETDPSVRLRCPGEYDGLWVIS